MPPIFKSDWIHQFADGEDVTKSRKDFSVDSSSVIEEVAPFVAGIQKRERVSAKFHEPNKSFAQDQNLSMNFVLGLITPDNNPAKAIRFSKESTSTKPGLVSVFNNTND